jgi:CheY-like chemotaxis protein
MMENSSNTVLVIDDEPLVLASVCHTLKRERYEIVSATDSAEGLRLFESHRPVCVILDLRMPVIDGVEFLKRMKISPDSDFAVIVLTAHGNVRDMQACYELGVSAFLRKPFDLFELISVTRNTVCMKRWQLKLKTQELLLRGNERKLLALLDSGDSVSVLLDMDGRVILANRAAELAAGEAGGPMTGRDIFSSKNFISDAAGKNNFERVAAAGGRLRHAHRAPDGKTHVVDMRIVSYDNPSPLRAVAVHITEIINHLEFNSL